MALFGLTGGYSKQKSTENSTTNENSTSTPNAPQWLTDAWTGVYGNAGQLGQQDPASFFAGASPLQTQAFDAASTLGYQPSSMIGDAATLAHAGASVPFSYNPAEMASARIGDTSHASASTAAPGIGAYLNPYTDTVVNQTISDLDRARKLTTVDDGRGAIGAGQYGGSRQGVLDASANRDFYDRVGAATGGLRAQGFTTALGAADSDAGRATQVSLANAGADNAKTLTQAQLDQQAGGANMDAKNTAWAANARAGDSASSRALQAAGLLGDLGVSSGAQAGSEARANIGLVGDLGGVQQGINQAQASAPLTLAQLLAQIYNQAPTDAFVGQTNTGTTTTNAKRTGSGFSLGASVGAK